MNYLNARNLEYAAEVRRQLWELCERAGLLHSSCGQDMDVVRKCLLTGLFHNVAELQRDKHYLTVSIVQSLQCSFPFKYSLTDTEIYQSLQNNAH